LNPSFDTLLEDLQRAAPAVLARLRGLATFPQHGTVAGQAVASAFWEALGLPMRGPINDIDVFVNMHMPREMRGKAAIQDPEAVVRPRVRQVTTTNLENKIGAYASPYGMATAIALRCSTHILRTYRDGLVNYTLVDGPYIHRDEMGHSNEVSASLVEGFDLNLVGVGINLDSGQVVASDGFLAFLATRKIQVQTCNTPAHTLIRLASKHFGGQITGALCDFEQERTLLEGALFCQSNQKHQQGGPGSLLAFGSGRYLSLYQQYASYLPDMVEVPYVPYGENQLKTTLHTFVPNEQAGAACQPLLDVARQAKFQVVTTLAMKPRFPQLWRKLQATDGTVQADVVDALGRVAQAEEEPEAMRALAQALDWPLPNMQVAGMDEVQQISFFFDQQCGKSPTLAMEAAAAWMAMDPLEQYVLIDLNIQADEVLALGRDKGYWRQLCAREGTRLLNSLAGITSSDGDYEELHGLLGRAMDHLEALGEHGRSQFVRAWGSLDTHQGEVGQFARLCHRGLGTGEEQHALAQRFMRMAYPGWPTPAVTRPQQVQDIFHYCANLVIDVDSTWIQGLGRLFIRKALLGAASGGRGDSSYDRGEVNTVFAQLLARTDLRDLRRNRFLLARAIVDGGGGEALAEHLLGQGEAGHAMLRHLHELGTQLELEKATTRGWRPGRAAIPKKGEDDWANTLTPRVKTGLVAVRRALLTLESQALPERQAITVAGGGLRM
jgi:hypothetical protein